MFREGLTQGASVRFEARAFAIVRALRDACLCLAIGIIVSCSARGVSPGCSLVVEMEPQVVEWLGTSRLAGRRGRGRRLDTQEAPGVVCSSGSQGLAVRD